VSARRRRFAQGEVIFHEGDAGTSLHIVAVGRVAVWASGTLGDSTMLNVLGPGEFFGELALVDADDIRTATVKALEPTETLSVTRNDFDELRSRHPSIDRVLVGALADRVRRLSLLVVEILFVPAEVRVINRLLAVAELWGGARPGLTIPLTQEDLAGLAGTTRSTVNRSLRDAEEAGLLRLGRRRIELLDPAALKARAHHAS